MGRHKLTDPTAIMMAVRIRRAREPALYAWVTGLPRNKRSRYIRETLSAGVAFATSPNTPQYAVIRTADNKHPARASVFQCWLSRILRFASVLSNSL